MNLPTKLDVRFNRVVESIHYSEDAFGESEYTTKVVCTDGEVIEADEIVMTTPLGVLKSDMIDFDPPLPPWKRGAINRMGFGLLNKVCLCSAHQVDAAKCHHRSFYYTTNPSGMKIATCSDCSIKLSEREASIPPIMQREGDGST